MTTNIDTTMGTEFWRTQPHVFVSAGWGPDYCRCCLDGKDTPIHDVTPDPATHPGNMTSYRVARPINTVFAVTGWSDNGASCSFAAMPSFDDCRMFIEHHLRGETADDRPPFDHYQINERTYFTAVDTNVAVIQ